MMDLAKMIVKSKTVAMEYPGFPGLFVNVAYLTRDELKALREKCTTQKFNKKTHQPEEDVDVELFQDIYIDSVIKGWSGFKYKDLTKMIPVDLSSVPADEFLEGEGDFEYSSGNARVLMKNCGDFDSWITSQLDDVENFTKTS